MEYAGGGRAGQVRDLVTAHLPGYRVRSVTLLGEGLDNVVYEVNGELVVRFFTCWRTSPTASRPTGTLTSAGASRHLTGCSRTCVPAVAPIRSAWCRCRHW
jgi:hypothetical protein